MPMPSSSPWPSRRSWLRCPTGSTCTTPRPRPRAAHYALSGILQARVEPGDRVLVNGATGAIGSAAVQLLADQGVDVIATAPTAHVELVRGLGARRVVDFEAEDFTGIDETVDVVLDWSARAPSGPAVASSAPGRLPLVRPRAVRAEPRPAAGHEARPRSPGGLPLPDVPARGARAPAVAPREPARSRPLLDPTTYPLEDIVEAYRYVETGQKLGNVVITVNEG